MTDQKRTPRHCRIPRSLLEDSYYTTAPATYRFFYLELIGLAYFTPQTQTFGSETIDFSPGQYCASIRELAEYCGLDKNDIERALKYWSSHGFLKYIAISLLKQKVRQQSRHNKTVITITHKDTCDLIKNECETESETESETQVRQILEERQTLPSSSPFPSSLSSSPNTPSPIPISLSSSSPLPRRGDGRSPRPKVSFNRLKKEFENITDEHRSDWERAFPGIAIKHELEKTRLYLLSPDGLSKTGNLKFLNSWMARSYKYMQEECQRKNNIIPLPTSKNEVERPKLVGRKPKLENAT